MIPGDTPILLAALLAGIATSAIVALRYFLASGLFAALTLRARPGLYDGLGPQIWREIRWSMLSALIYGAPVGFIMWGWHHHGWTRITADWSALPLWYLPLSVFVYLFVQDTWFYWTHRAMHIPRLFRLAHAVHHQSRPPTAWTAMSFHPLEALSGAVVVPVLVFLLPIHVAMLGLVLAIASVMGVTNHMGWEIFPRRLVHSAFGNWVITASHHERHHEEYRCNFGLYFRFWDRVCGTDRGLTRRFAGRAAAIMPAPEPIEAQPADLPG
jgi:sterol desaturase/sphingolipid hydroxylase (fatty acid hydroxylase superfamily)